LATNTQDEQRLALFIDFENIAIGVRDAHYRKFDVNLVLERLLDKGKLLVKRAYADWSRYSDYKRSFHEAAIELIEVPQKSIGGKNSADIRLVVDAMDMSFQKEHVNCFVVASGDSDFSPLVSKLKENNKYVIGLGVKNSTSDLLIENCDEFIFYEDLVRGQQRQIPVIDNLPQKQQECFGLLVDSVLALQRENKELLWGSMVKETMKRKKPSFNETYYGYRTFSHLLEDAQRKGIVTLRRDQRSGSYIIEDLGSSAAVSVSAAQRGETQPRSEAPPAVASPTPPGPPPVSQLASREAAGASGLAPAGSSSGSAGAPGEGEANGRPRPRRRRGRRGRGPLTPAETATGPAPGGSPTETGPDLDDEPDDDSPEGADEHVAEASRSEASPAEGSAEPPAAQGPPQTEPGRSPFSFFSWMRRDPEEPKE
jgi:uncharacterized LabA/DUF88 family protein